MALKATIYKATVNLSDLDRNHYTDHQLTLACHPSETGERMMLRLLAFVLQAPENNDRGTLEFGKEMWDPDEPCLWQKDLTGLIEHWIDLGQPDEKRLRQALTGIRQEHRSGIADRVGDVAFLMQASERVPVVTFPDATVLMQAEKQQRKDGIVDFIRIDFGHTN